ncbi:hypothetical protein PENSPDRAFT_97945 [Peniophora sp. CONT]|nr:hypothetical protein PENSPDRAFT_97945 [Peniophora sp. CONT]
MSSCRCANASRLRAHRLLILASDSVLAVSDFVHCIARFTSQPWRLLTISQVKPPSPLGTVLYAQEPMHSPQALITSPTKDGCCNDNMISAEVERKVMVRTCEGWKNNAEESVQVVALDCSHPKRP